MFPISTISFLTLVCLTVSVASFLQPSQILLLPNDHWSRLISQQQQPHRSHHYNFLQSSRLRERATSSTNHREKAAPILITIGPPSCGKTEALRSYLLSKGYNPDDVFSRDVALDEQSSVYHRIPLADFLFPNSTTSSFGDPRTDSELRTIVLRLAGRITPDEFEERIWNVMTTMTRNDAELQRKRELAYDLRVAVEQVVVQAVGEVICQLQLPQQDDNEDDLPYDSDKTSTEAASNNNNTLDTSALNNTTQAHLLSARALIKTPHVDVFVPKALFQGFKPAKRSLRLMLKRSSPTQPIFWGNTNTSPKEYASVLSAAQDFGRPVDFVAWGTPRLPRFSRTELLRRNVARFRNTGRYVPAGAVVAALGRIETLLEAAADGMDQAESLEDCCRWNVALAALAGFEMDSQGYVGQVGEPIRLRRPSNGVNRRVDSQRAVNTAIAEVMEH